MGRGGGWGRGGWNTRGDRTLQGGPGPSEPCAVPSNRLQRHVCARRHTVTLRSMNSARGTPRGGTASGGSPGCRPAAGSCTSTCRPPRCAARPQARRRRQRCPRPPHLCRGAGERQGAVSPRGERGCALGPQDPPPHARPFSSL